jgi:hypothetical protein
VILVQELESRSISLNADPSGFHAISGSIPGNHSIPPDGFYYTTSSGPIKLMRKTGAIGQAGSFIGPLQHLCQ